MMQQPPYKCVLTVICVSVNSTEIQRTSWTSFAFSIQPSESVDLKHPGVGMGPL